MKSPREPNNDAWRGPDQRKRDTVLAAVKDATRRLRRWPAAILDSVCARRHWTDAGRHEETALGRTKKLIKKTSAKATSLKLRQPLRAVPFQSAVHRLALNCRYHPNCRVSSRSKMSTLSPVEHLSVSPAPWGGEETLPSNGIAHPVSSRRRRRPRRPILHWRKGG